MKFQTEYEAAWTNAGEILSLKTGDWRYQRPVTKSEKCCQCGWCYLICPTGSVVDAGTYFTANLDYCKGCGICAKVCPVDAIMLVREERQ
jgi:pyruvate ferredoxin oxidoreductase delta subunit